MSFLNYKIAKLVSIMPLLFFVAIPLARGVTDILVLGLLGFVAGSLSCVFFIRSRRFSHWWDRAFEDRKGLMLNMFVLSLVLLGFAIGQRDTVVGVGPGVSSMVGYWSAITIGLLSLYRVEERI